MANLRDAHIRPRGDSVLRRSLLFVKDLSDSTILSSSTDGPNGPRRFMVGSMQRVREPDGHEAIRNMSSGHKCWVSRSRRRGDRQRWSRGRQPTVTLRPGPKRIPTRERDCNHCSRCASDVSRGGSCLRLSNSLTGNTTVHVARPLGLRYGTVSLERATFSAKLRMTYCEAFRRCAT